MTDIAIFIQRRVPTYDGGIRTSLSCDGVRARLQEFFTRGRQPLRGFVLFDTRFYGEFDGENSFVVRSYSSAAHGSLRPLVDGYLVENENGGCDVLFRVTYPRLWWVIDALLLGLIAIGSVFSSGKLADILVIFPAAPVLAAITFLPVWLEGSAFAQRVGKLLAAAAA